MTNDNTDLAAMVAQSGLVSLRGRDVLIEFDFRIDAERFVNALADGHEADRSDLKSVLSEIRDLCHLETRQRLRSLVDKAINLTGQENKDGQRF